MTATVPVSAAIGRTLATLGAAHVFGVVGSGNFHLTNAMVDTGVPFTAARHEMGATVMADAYSRTSDRVAVVSLHQGCGLSNALTGIAEAAKCHTPLLVVTGDTATGDVNSNFHVDQDAAVRAMGATAARVYSAETAVADTARAYIRAVTERETVVLSVPVDIQDRIVELDETSITLPRVHRAGPSSQALTDLVELLAGARRPVILAGRGARHAKTELVRLADHAGALLVTSAGARGLFADQEWALDVMGGFSTEGAAELIAAADVVVGFGASLNKWTGRDGALMRGATVVHVDDRPAAIGRHRDVALGVIGDAAIVAALAADQLEQRPRSGTHRGYRTADVARRVHAARYWRDQPFEPLRDPGCIDPRELTNLLDELLPAERIVVPDGGNVNCYPAGHLRVPDVRGFCFPLAFQAIGMGIAAGIGAGIAQPGRVPVVGTGDGAFMMSLAELDTAVRARLGLVVIVYNDSAYGAEVNLFRPYTDDLDIVRFPDTDMARVARGFGAEGVTVREISDLGPVREWVDGPRDRPLVIDAKIATFPSWLMAQRYVLAEDATHNDLSSELA
ncbi:thiamine pyrophosphate-binding protein [Microbacterium kribbense]|uniref:Thiamine pyrophosphate-binding protein n=1 Tax=Microbacterium kribbense TaxID=433645 RepID=A0ABP7GEL2_9MICO